MGASAGAWPTRRSKARSLKVCLNEWRAVLLFCVDDSGLPFSSTIPLRQVWQAPVNETLGLGGTAKSVRASTASRSFTLFESTPRNAHIRLHISRPASSYCAPPHKTASDYLLLRPSGSTGLSDPVCIKV